MKKLFIYTAVVAMMAVSSACTHEEEPIFDKSAAERLDEAKDQLSKDLTDNGGKWVMEYFANGNEEGYIYVMTFKKDGSVTICGNNDWIGGTTKSETSLWGVNTDDGVVLSFNSYNPIFHVFSDPDNFTDGSGINYTGKGHEGDYEFIYIGLSPDGKKLTLKGKKRGLPIYMYRLDPNVDDEAYINKVKETRDAMFSTGINRVILTYAPTGERFVFEDGAYGLPSVYPEAGDKITQTVSANGIFTADGFRFMEPFEIPTAADPNATITIYSFKLQPDGTLVSDDEYAAGSTIAAADLGTVVTYTNCSWLINEESGVGGQFDALINDIKDQLKSAKGSFKMLSLQYDATMQTYVLVCNATIRSGVSSRPATSTFYLSYDVPGDGTITPKYEGCDDATKKLMETVPALKEFVDAFCSKKFTLTSVNRLAPNDILMISGNDVIKLTVQ